MLKLTYADQAPIVKKLQGAVLVPCNVREQTYTDEDGTQKTHFVYRLLRHQGPKIPDLEELRTILMTQLNQDNQAYIYSHYDQGTQASFQAIYTDPGSSQATKDSLTPVLQWIRDQVLAYYYQKKNELRLAQDQATLSGILWDFQQFDQTKPAVTLEGLLGS